MIDDNRRLPAPNPVALGLLLLVVALGLSLGSLGAPLIWDDLHLIRAYSPAELAGTWHGSWDPDGLETPGLRPLTTLFNHLRYTLLGESLAGQRALLVALLCADLLLLYLLARELFGAPPAVGALAGLLALSHPTAVGTYLWIADGVHPWELFWLIGSLLALARYLRAGGRALAAASLLGAAVALLTRPEASLLLPLATLVAAVVAAGSVRRRAAAYLLGLALLLVGFWIWQLATVRLEPAWVFPAELAWALREVVGLGASPPAQARTVSLALLVRALCGSLGLAALAIAASPRGRRRALFWAVAGVVGALHTLVGARSNLLLLPVLFWALAVATLAVDAAASTRRRVVALAVLAPLLASHLLLGSVLQREHRWNNLEWVCAHALALYGDPPLRGVPPTRRAALAAMLADLGIRSEPDLRAALPGLIADARRDGRLGPGPDDRPFLPHLSLLVGPDRWITPCGEDVARGRLDASDS